MTPRPAAFVGHDRGLLEEVGGLDRVSRGLLSRLTGAAGRPNRVQCRERRPGLLIRRARDLEFPLRRPVMVGGQPSHVDAGAAAGAAGALVVAGGGRGALEHRWRRALDRVTEDLPGAVEWARAGRLA